jgi:methyl-accepting chemotaxis protein
VEAIRQVLQILESGNLDVDPALLDQCPDTMRAGFATLIQTWNERLAAVQVAASAALEEGARTLFTSEELVATAREQSQQSAGLAAVSEELAASIEEVASSTAHASSGSQGTLRQVDTGTTKIEAALNGMTGVANQVQGLTARVAELTKAVATIQPVLDLIGEVSGRTNLLALNAAIEAARAGEHGRGFAVVAGEVRKLSERTRSAVEDIRTRLSALQGGAQAVSALMAEVSSQADKGVSLANEAKDALREIGSAVAFGLDPMKEIAASASGQASAVEEVAVSAEQAARASERVEAAAIALADMVSNPNGALRQVREQGNRFRLKLRNKDTLQLARADHVMWILRLHAMLKGQERLIESDVQDYTQCRLGNWYYGPGKATVGHLPGYRKLEAPHARLHDVARKSVIAYNQGRVDEATTGFHEVSNISREILSLLSDLQQQP